MHWGISINVNTIILKSLFYRSDYLLDKLEELDLNWQKKENSLTEQLKTYNSKIEELEKNLKAKNKELNEQKIIEDRIMLFEKRITNT